jgi:hypothetical protein
MGISADIQRTGGRWTSWTWLDQIVSQMSSTPTGDGILQVHISLTTSVASDSASSL